MARESLVVEIYVGAKFRDFSRGRQDRGGGVADPPASLGRPPTWMEQAWGREKYLYLHYQGPYGGL